MSYAAEPYVQFVDDLLTALTGGVIRDEFRFLPENEPYLLHAPGPPVPSTVRISGQAARRVSPLPERQGLQARAGLHHHVARHRGCRARPIRARSSTRTTNTTALPASTRRSPTAIPAASRACWRRASRASTRCCRGSWKAIYNASFVETATGRDLDQIGLLVGVERRTATFAIGSVVFFRSTPSPADIFIPAGTRVSTGKPPAAQFETQVEATLRRGSLSAEALIQALASGPAGVVAAQAIQRHQQPDPRHRRRQQSRRRPDSNRPAKPTISCATASSAGSRARGRPRRARCSRR